MMSYLKDFFSLPSEMFLLCLGLVILILDLLLPEKHKRRLLINLSVWSLLAGLLLVAMRFDFMQAVLFGGTVVVDNLSIFFKLIILLSTIFVLVMTRYFPVIKDSVIGEFIALVIFAALGMLFMSSANDLLVIFLSIEFVSIAFFILVGYLRKDLKSSEGALKYFLIGAFSSAVFLYGMTLVIGVTGTGKLFEIKKWLDAGGGNPLFTLGLLFMLVGFGFKIALVPFHSWAPDAYEGAPTPITALLSVASKAAGIAVFLRVLLAVSGGKIDLTLLLAIISAVTMTTGNLIALTQNNIKRLLAYSGIAHAGFIMIGITAAASGAGSTPGLGVQSVLIYTLAYMFMNIGIFALVIAIFNKTGSDDIRDYAGLSAKNPYLALLLVLFLMSLAGLPPTAGFLGKLYVFSAALDSNLAWLAVLGIINSVIALYYYFRIAYNVYFAAPKITGPVIAGTGLKVIIAVSAAMVLLICVYPEPVIILARESLAMVCP